MRRAPASTQLPSRCGSAFARRNILYCHPFPLFRTFFALRRCEFSSWNIRYRTRGTVSPKRIPQIHLLCIVMFMPLPLSVPPPPPSSAVCLRRCVVPTDNVVQSVLFKMWAGTYHLWARSVCVCVSVSVYEKYARRQPRACGSDFYHCFSSQIVHWRTANDLICFVF